MRALAISMIVLAARPVSADSDHVMSLSLGYVIGFHEAMEDGSESLFPRFFSGPRMMLGFERAPLPYPDKPGYRVGAQLVPELIGAAFIDRDAGTADMMFGAGLRAEPRIAQREMGIFRMSARSALYLALRGFLVGEESAPMMEVMAGTLLEFDRLRFGAEIGGMQRRAKGMEPATGVTSQLFVGTTF